MIEELMSYGNVLENVDLKEYNTFKLGGKAKYLVDVKDKESLINLIKFLKTKNIKYFIIGNGSNIVMSDNLFDGVIIKLSNLNKFTIDYDTKIVTAQAGLYFPVLVAEVVNNNLKGLEWATGIPGTIGGSVVANAGAYNSAIFEFLKSVEILDADGIIKTLEKDDIKYDYRYSMFQDQKDITILSVVFELEHGNKEESNALIADRRKRRLESQPLEFPSAGSIFRNPDGEEIKEQIEKYGLKGPYAGHLIEECGLRGKRIGNAAISEKHANFIVNLGNAESNDVKALIDLAKNTVKEKFEIELKIEQEFVNWE